MVNIQNIIAINHPDATREMNRDDGSDSDDSICVEDMDEEDD